VELRNPACINQGLMALLRKHRIAWVIADTAGRFPYAEEVTTDFVYVRLHGDTQLYASDYGPRAIARWAERVACWSAGNEPKDAVHLAAAAPGRARDVYVYFDNDGSAYAPHNAEALQAVLIAKQLDCSAPAPAPAPAPRSPVRKARARKSRH
jgi:uncharacterized protein YecE (DUF72 family)